MSRTPLVEPGRLTMSVRPRTPATPRLSAARGKVAPVTARSRSAMPGASRSITARVASGVTSRGLRPGAAGGEHEIGDVAVAPGEELAHDGDDVVAHDGARGDGAADRRDPGDGGVARAVGALAARRRVGDGEHRHPHACSSRRVRDGTRACRRAA